MTGLLLGEGASILPLQEEFFGKESAMKWIVEVEVTARNEQEAKTLVLDRLPKFEFGKFKVLGAYPKPEEGKQVFQYGESR